MVLHKQTHFLGGVGGRPTNQLHLKNIFKSITKLKVNQDQRTAKKQPC